MKKEAAAAILRQRIYFTIHFLGTRRGVAEKIRDSIQAIKSRGKKYDRTKLGEWGSPKGLPKGWRGRILRGEK